MSAAYVKKVIVIGLDGLEPKIVEPMLAAGELPNLAGLRAGGGYARLATTYPAQTPVAWSTFATGTNPGGHGIFDFIRRDPQTYLPDLGLNRYEQKNAFLPPKVVNLRRGTAVWELLAAAGVESSVLRCPCTYPPDAVRGRMLSGMGVPDLRGGLGTPTFYTTAAGLPPRESETVVHVRPDPGGAIRTHLLGPRRPKAMGNASCPLTLHPDPAARAVVIRVEGAPRETVVRQGEWSGWLRVRFKRGLLQAVPGMVRFHLVRLEPAFELYTSPVNFDPAAPLFPISAPEGYAGELSAALGSYATTGMVEEHTGLNLERIDERAFLAQCDDVWREREAMLWHELERRDEGLVFCLFDTPDRVQHMFWRHREPDHPAHRGEPVPAEFARVIEENYRRGDRVVGEVLRYADEDTLVVALSDHGFNSFRRGVHLNTWLYDHGLLALNGGVRPGEEAGACCRAVDWGRTKAYALGLGGIYLNLKGREGQGVVAPEEAGALKAEIARGLSRLTDPASGAVAVRSVLPREAIYSGPYTDEAPDLVVNFAAGYRASWDTALGGVPAALIEDNRKKWAGDHIIDPAVVPGVLFLNRPFRAAGARMVDLAPTILDALGVPNGPALEGSSLLS